MRKKLKHYAIRRYKNPKEFEYLADDNIWKERKYRKRFDNRETAEKRVKAYNSVGVHARLVPYGENESE